ncbi:deleted in malignant brain tumors 1 protein-like [Actinia tenebrosa]|uniref:Deleted in malignant brain tumors 1 protein-like n=1 Tax=Actinia tenebrosa TaxID=6105 RepID=A0A6P8HDU2_ACTTE|nr:deleted in malignant brain tumors 1 protein-like [Actinia tenebrosa]
MNQTTALDSEQNTVCPYHKLQLHQGVNKICRISSLTTPTEIPTMSTDTTTMASTTSWSAPSGSPPTWPYGKYTLLKPRTGCPAGWDDKGYLYQDTIDTNPSNNRSQTLHIDGKVARSHVKRHFCSKTNKDGETYGKVPYHELGNRKHQGITMFYCYYESCKYILRDKNGTFQSPGFSGKYPDGQLCSWRIMVPVNHTVQVRFTNVSLNDNDTLRYSERYSTRSNGSFRSWHTIPLHSTVPFSLSADSELLFVFSSDESKTSSGFRAEYRVSIPQATTTPRALTTPTEIPTMSTDTTTMASTTSWSAPSVIFS